MAEACGVVLCVDTTTVAGGIGLLSGRFSDDGAPKLVGSTWKKDRDQSALALNSDGTSPLGAANLETAKYMMEFLLKPAHNGQDAFSVCRIPLLQESMPANLYGLILGLLCEAIETANFRLEGIIFDNASYVEDVDGTLLQCTMATERTQSTPFFRDVTPWPSRQLASVPYRVAAVHGHPIHSHRDALRYCKSGARQAITSSHTIMLGEVVVDFTSRLQTGLPISSYTLRDVQSDDLALTLLHPHYASTAPDGVGASVYSWLIFNNLHAHFDESMGTEDTFLFSLFNDYVHEALRMLACDMDASKATVRSTNFLDPYSYRIATRVSIAPALVVYTRPASWNRWRPRCIQSRFIEAHFSILKGTRRSGYVTVADYEREVGIHNNRMADRSKSWTGQTPSEVAPMSSERQRKLETIAKKAALMFVVKCCPVKYPAVFAGYREITLSFAGWVDATLGRSVDVSEALQPPVEEIAEDIDAEDVAVDVTDPAAFEEVLIHVQAQAASFFEEDTPSLLTSFSRILS